MGASVFRKFNGRPAQARQPRAATSTFENGAQREERAIWQSVRGLRNPALKRRWPHLARPALEAGGLDEALNCGLESAADA